MRNIGNNTQLTFCYKLFNKLQDLTNKIEETKGIIKIKLKIKREITSEHHPEINDKFRQSYLS